MFDSSHRVNHRRRQLPAGNWEILDRPLGLGSIVGVCRNLDFAHRVAFGSHLSGGIVGIGRHRINLSKVSRYDNCSPAKHQGELQDGLLSLNESQAAR